MRKKIVTAIGIILLVIIISGCTEQEAALQYIPPIAEDAPLLY